MFPNCSSGKQKSNNQNTSNAANDGHDGKKATSLATKAASDGDDGKKATGLATNQFFSDLAFAMIFFPFFLNA